MYYSPIVEILSKMEMIAFLILIIYKLILFIKKSIKRKQQKETLSNYSVKIKRKEYRRR